MLCWRAPSPPRIRYKILPARCCANQSGTKLSLHAEKAPNRAISGEQGEFCTGHAVRRGVRGEFCTGGARCGCCWASCVVLWRSPCASWRAMAVPRRHPRALRPGPPAPPAPSAPVGLNRWWVVHGRAYVCTREKVRPVRSQHPKFGVFTCAGRVFSRKSRRRGRAGRTFSRKSRRRGGVGRIFSSSVPHSGVTVWWSARLIWVRSPCDPSRKLSTSDSK